MPRPSIDLQPHRDEITRRIKDEHWKLNAVVEALEKDHKIRVKKRTLERNLAAWGVSTQPRLKNRQELCDRLNTLFKECLLTDDQICELLNEAGFTINFHTIKRLRKQMGLNKRVLPGTEQELQDTIRDLLEKEYQDESIKKLSRNNLYAHLRAKYPQHSIIGRDRVFKIAREMNPECRKKHKTKGPLQDDQEEEEEEEEEEGRDSRPTPPQGYAPAQPYPATPALAADYSDTSSAEPMDHQPTIDPALANATAAAEALHTTSRLELLERENAALHQRLHQQDAEIGYLRQAYNDLLARFNSAPPPSGFRT